jgi:hypothetical protein
MYRVALVRTDVSEHILPPSSNFIKVMGFHSCVTVESLLISLSIEGYYIWSKNIPPRRHPRIPRFRLLPLSARAAIPDTPWIGGWMGPLTCTNKNKNNSCPHQELNHNFLSCEYHSLLY